MKKHLIKRDVFLGTLLFVSLGFSARAETPQQWVTLGKRVHGGFGTYIALGIRIGLDAQQRLKAAPRTLDVTYFSGANAPCPCVADGVMLATGATPGQGSLRVAATSSPGQTFGVAEIRNKSGHLLRYTIPASAQASLEWWNVHQNERGRFDAVMSAPQSKLFSVQVVAQTKRR